METCSVDLLKISFISGAQKVIECETYLCELDGYIGDGDHGVTATRGFRGAIDAIEHLSTPTIADLFKTTGAALAKHMGGAIGPIFGSIFSGAASSFTGFDCDLTTFSLAMEKSLSFVKSLGGAKEGDRTLIDAFSPYVTSLKNSVTVSHSFAEALQLAACCAELGAESTKAMKATKGRAKFLGEKSIGYRDAGASSFTIFVTALASTVTDRSTI